MCYRSGVCHTGLVSTMSSFLPHRFFALTSLRLLFLVAFTLIVVVCVDQWKSKIWPEIGGKL